MSQKKFKNRKDAGKKLALKLIGYKGRKDVLVLGIPRGGVPVAASVAKDLKLPFDVVISRKLPLPWDTEAAFGAVSEGGVILEDERFVEVVSKAKLAPIIRHIRAEVERRVKLYRKGRQLNVAGKVVIVVDDGIASSWTVAAAVKYLKQLDPKKIIVAVPCASSTALKTMKNGFEVRVLESSKDPMFAVPLCYEEFQQLTDEQALEYLKDAPAPIRAVKKIFGKAAKSP